eukprot:14837_5
MTQTKLPSSRRERFQGEVLKLLGHLRPSEECRSFRSHARRRRHTTGCRNQRRRSACWFSPLESQRASKTHQADRS